MRFKQFSVDDSRCAMKVGTDGILLGAWLSCEGAGKLLDIGTGSGLIALMAGQRCAAGGDRLFHITAIDIDAEAAGQAAENFAASRWAGSMSALPLSLAEFVAAGHAGEFDVIVCNPPYYITGRSIVPAGARRSAARRDAELSLDDVVKAATTLLAPTGRLALILPTAREADLLAAVADAGMSIVRRCYVRTTPVKAPSRLLMEISWGRSSGTAGTYPTNQPSANVQWCRSDTSDGTYPSTDRDPEGPPAKGDCVANIFSIRQAIGPKAEGRAATDNTYLTIGSEEFKTLTGDFYL